MMDILALKLAKAIKKAEPERTASVEVLKFSLEGVLNVLVTMVFVFVVGLFTGHLLEGFIGLAAFIFLRFFSGGVHLQKSMYCSIFTTAIICAAPLFNLNNVWFYITTAITIVLLALYAPANIEGHARLPIKYFPYLKLIAIIIVLLNVWLYSSTIAMVFLAQAITTIPLLNKEVNKS